MGLDRLLTRKYISKEGEKNLKTFNYAGDDPSYLYKYVNSPLAQFIVDHFTPRWLAPNVITFMGFSFTLIMHIICFYYAQGEMQAEYYPRWMHLCCALAIWFYSICDNMDGKQARRTKSGSVLGATVDHGVDAINAGIIGITLISSINMQNTKAYYAMAVVAFMPIFTAAWEEYHVGGMFMPVINGPNEGLLALESLHLITFFCGIDWWHQDVGYGLVRADLFMFYTIFQGQFTSAQNIIRVINCKNGGPILKRFKRLGMLVFIMACVILVQVCSPTNIAVRKARWVIYFFHFGWAKCVTLIHVWYGSGQELELFRKSVVIPFAIFTLNCVLGFFLGAAPIDEDILLYIGVATTFSVYLHFALSVIRHFADFLGIKVFSITPAAKSD